MLHHLFDDEPENPCVFTSKPRGSALQCYQCTDETCDKKDMRGKCSGALCYKTVVSSPEGLSMIKGCIKTPPTSKLIGCYPEDIKLSSGVYKGQKCYCKYDDFCNKSQAIKCYQCNEDTCSRSDSRGKCSGSVCSKTLVYDKSQGKEIMLKGCIRSNQSPSTYGEQCTSEKFKLSGGVAWGTVCYCQNQDFCNGSTNLHIYNAFVVLLFSAFPFFMRLY
uniref:Uncharacterized protein n=1 Tax=Romanomermis culicivorax TaxID=13658 RepID=A0A915K8W8_ROMCU